MEEDWYKEWKLLIGFLLMCAIAIATPITILNTERGEFPVYLIVLLVLFGIWMIYFLIRNRMNRQGEIVAD